MSRIETLAGTVQLVTLAPRIVIDWDPVAETAMVRFEMARYLTVDGVYRGDVPPSSSSGALSLSLAQLYARQFMTPGYLNSAGQDISRDPVTNADLSQISVGGLDRLLRVAFDTLHNELLGAP